MAVKAVFFDLDGTLLPMDQDSFVMAYFKAIATDLTPHGYEPEKLINTIWGGTRAMVENNGSKTNEDAFWSYFISVYGKKAQSDYQYFEKFYSEKFDSIKGVCGFNPKSNEIISKLKDSKIQLVLATNPIFPRVATEKRIAWAGLVPSDFDFITTYENSSYCKPNLNYYKSILNRLNISACEAIMIGNDVSEDMIAKEIGMNVFLLKDNLINKCDKDISEYPGGSFDELSEFLDNETKK